ncbi:MAG: hypothetical protein ISS52_07565 [Dehalococcoidia bacterium]|nr:hypothetical protein [Dehalococcoidia bacterium]
MATMSSTTYRTSDLYVAAWLLANAFHLEDVDYADRRRCAFIFHDGADRPQLVREFLQGSATGNVADFVYYLRKAKRLLYSCEQ